MRWLLSAYTIRLNHRHKLFGHVFSGRYKALLAQNGSGYLKTVCDYVHLNPARAKLLKAEERLLAYPWSSLVWYVAASAHRPQWMRVDRLLGEHGILADTEAGRQEFEKRMEARRGAQIDEKDRKAIERGWCFGSAEFRQTALEKIDGKLGVNHSGQERAELAEEKAGRIIHEELKRLGWKTSELARRRKGDADKLAIASRLRKETTLTVKRIAERLCLGNANSATARLREWVNKEGKTNKR